MLQEFMDAFQAHKQMSSINDPDFKQGDGKITLNKFLYYYSNVSASIDNDEYFQLMITNAWNLDNKQFQQGCQNGILNFISLNNHF